MRYDWRGSLLIVLNFDQKAIRYIEGGENCSISWSRTRAARMQADSQNVLEAKVIDGYRVGNLSHVLHRCA